MKKKFFCNDRWLGIGLIVIAAFFAWQATFLRASNLQRDPGPKIFPWIGCGILAVCGILLFIKPGPDGKRMKLDAGEKKRLWTMLAIYIGCVICTWLLGVLIALPIMLFIVSYLFSKSSRPDMPKKKRLITTLIYTVLLFAAVYLIYIVVLDVEIQPGIILKALDWY